MKYMSLKKWTAISLLLVLVSCSGKTDKKAFQVSGVITNNMAQKIYLEEIPLATMQRIVVDSVNVDKDGKYILHDNPKESSVFNIRTDQNTYPIASVVNDASSIQVDFKFSKGNSQFPEGYEVKGSPASSQMKEFMYAFNNMLQRDYVADHMLDSLTKAKASTDTLLNLQQQKTAIGRSIRDLSLDYIHRSDNPALTMFELGYYQSTANSMPGAQLESLSIDTVNDIVNNLSSRFPNHKGIKLVLQSLDEQAKKLKGLVGLPAPEIALPDPAGKEIKLSAFKGKYVLVDFWASWCKPCRAENPNVVKAFNHFKEKNFTILGVSLDQTKDEWVKAIMQDGLTWNHVSDLQYWNSAVVPLYNIEGIPFNVLVDPSGIVIAQDLRGPELEKKLGEVLH